MKLKLGQDNYVYKEEASRNLVNQRIMVSAQSVGIFQWNTCAKYGWVNVLVGW